VCKTSARHRRDVLLKGGNTNTVGSYAINIYVHRPRLEQCHLDDGRRVCFLSRDSDGKFKALVLSVSGADEKNCKVK
jgi:hypothetical protein